jgi:hypothetical protein
LVASHAVTSVKRAVTLALGGLGPAAARVHEAGVHHDALAHEGLGLGVLSCGVRRALTAVVPSSARRLFSCW